VTTGRQEWELKLNCAFNVASGSAKENTEPAIEAELLVVSTHEVQHRAKRLVLRLSKTSSQLLNKQRGTVGRSQHENRVHIGNIDALLE
jgi:hypothetical protein